MVKVITDSTDMTYKKSEHKLDYLRKIFGHEMVALPIREGTKSPFLKGWPEFTQESMADPNYVRYFDLEENVGILLATENDDGSYTVTLDLDTDEAYEQFCALNPEFSKTATVRGERGAKVFFRVTWLPPNGKITDGDGNEIGDVLAKRKQAVVHGIHPSGCEYDWISTEPPIEVDLRKLNYPEGWLFPWPDPIIEFLREEHGDEYTESKTGSITLNESFFAALTSVKNDLHYQDVERRFYLYGNDTGLWSPVSGERVKRLIRHSIHKYGNFVDPDLQSRILLKITDRFLSATLKQLKTLTQSSKEMLKTQTRLIHFTNGVLDISDWQLRPFSKEDYLCSGIPFVYDCDAQCPKFLAFLNSVLSAEDVRLLQKLVGAYLVGLNEAQVIVLIYGTPGGGKSTLLRIVTLAVGVRNVANLRPKHIASRFELAQLRAARLLIGPDVSKDFLNDENAQHLKAMTGGDPLTCELKGVNEPFEITGDFNIIVSSNARPRIHMEEDKGAWKRRLIAFEFSGDPPEKPIPNFAEQLIAEEGAGIVQWALEGLKAYREDLLMGGRLKRTSDQNRRVDDILNESESLRQFIQNYVFRSKGRSVATSQIQSHYAEFCSLKGWSPVPDSKFRKMLPDLMQEFHYASESRSVGAEGSGQGYRGFELAPFDGRLPGLAA